MSARWRMVVYGAALLAALGPGAVRAGGGVPGSPHSDLWNTIWSLWHGLGGLGHTAWLNHPDGGSLVVADPLNAVFLAPLVLLVGAASAWTVGVAFHLLLAMVASDGLAGAVGATNDGRLVAGLAYGTTPLLLAGVHNGTSEAVSMGLIPLALWALVRFRDTPSRRRGALAVGALWLAAMGGPYLAVATWMGAVWLWLAGPQRRAVALALVVATIAYLPWAAWVHALATAPDNLVGIKHPHELGLVRRTIGGSDPLSFVVPGDFRSPDFRTISRYGEDFIHCTYLGWVWLLAAGVGLRRGGRWVWGVAGLVAALLALGPVWVHGGSAVLFGPDLGLPLPYILVEWVPGLASLSLVYRLAALSALAVSVLAAFAFDGRLARLVAAVGVLEIFLLSPMAGGPDFAAVPDSAPLVALHHAEPGAVVNYPVEGGRPYLFEATVHGKPLAGTLNFPENDASRSLWKSLQRAPDDGWVQAASSAGRRLGVRYIVLHVGGAVESGPHRDVVERMKNRVEPMAVGGGMEVYKLW